jgi:hypothetical protein
MSRYPGEIPGYLRNSGCGERKNRRYKMLNGHWEKKLRRDSEFTWIFERK